MHNKAIDLLNQFIAHGDTGFTYLYDRHGTKILRHADYSDLIIKISNKDKDASDNQMKIVGNIRKDISYISRIFLNQEYYVGDINKTIEVINFLPGKKVEQYNHQQLTIIMKNLRDLHLSIKENQINDVNLPNIRDLFYGIVANSQDTDLKLIADTLLQNGMFIDYINGENTFITIGDLINDNILIDENDMASFIDLDPLILGPENLQIAILLSSNILLQKNYLNNMKSSQITDLYHIWGYENANVQDYMALALFPLLMLSIRNVEYSKIEPIESNIFYRLKTLLEFVIDAITSSK